MKRNNYYKSLNPSESEITDFAQNYSRDEEMFVNEENILLEEQKQTRAAESDLKNQIHELGIVSDPGWAPEYGEIVFPTLKTMSSIAGAGLVLIFVFHCVIWFIKLFSNIRWNTWGWTTTYFFWVLGILVATFVICSAVFLVKYIIWKRLKNKYVTWKYQRDDLMNRLTKVQKMLQRCTTDIDNVHNNRARVLARAYGLHLGLPIKAISPTDYKKARNQFFSLFDLRTKTLSQPIDGDKFEHCMEYYNEKIRLFYEYSIPAEAQSSTALSKYRKAANAVDGLRGEPQVSELTTDSVTRLSDKLKHWKNTSLDHYIDDFNEISKRDTSGFISKTNTNALESQTNDLESMFNETTGFYKKYQKTASSVFETLELARLLAFRNIYLGVEFFNIYFDTTSGGKLTTQQDTFDSSIELTSVAVDNIEYSTELVFDQIVSSALSSALNVLPTDDKSVKLAMDNPKMALGAVGAALISGAVDAFVESRKHRKAKIEALIKKQKAIISNMDRIVNAYSTNLPLTMRAIEITREIIKANQGFSKIYNDLAKKAFDEKQSAYITRTELTNLKRAIDGYKKISDSQL